MGETRTCQKRKERTRSKSNGKKPKATNRPRRRKESQRKYGQVSDRNRRENPLRKKKEKKKEKRGGKRKKIKPE